MATSALVHQVPAPDNVATADSANQQAGPHHEPSKLLGLGGISIPPDKLPCSWIRAAVRHPAMSDHGPLHVLVTHEPPESSNLVCRKRCPSASRPRPQLGNFWIGGEPHPDRLVGSNGDFMRVQEEMLANGTNHGFRDARGLGNPMYIPSHAPDGGIHGLGLCIGDAFTCCSDRSQPCWSRSLRSAPEAAGVRHVGGVRSLGTVQVHVAAAQAERVHLPPAP